jgi:alpha-beta hydrolase superfamily lysophospholipase
LRRISDAALCGLFAAGLYVGRGLLIAAQSGGWYAPADRASDAIAAFVLIAAIRLVDLTIAVWSDTPRRWQRNLTAVTRLAVAVLFAAPLVMSLVQFCPQRIRSRFTPASVGLQYEAFEFNSEGYRLAGWDVPASKPEAPVVLVTHGLGVNQSAFLHVARMLHDLDCHVVTFDFRAHGDSQGRVTTFGYREAADVQAAREWVARKYPHRPCYAMGYSMGGAAVLRAASRQTPFDGIVVDSTFARAEDVARSSFLRPLGPLKTPAWRVGRLWGAVLSGCDLQELQPIQGLSTLAARRVLLIHGENDSLISCRQSQDLAAAAQAQTHCRATLWLVPGADHVQSILIAPDYADRVREFIYGGD